MPDTLSDFEKLFLNYPDLKIKLIEALKVGRFFVTISYDGPTKPGDPNMTINLADVEFEREVGTLMPDNLIAAMSDTQRNDLFKFLLGLGLEESIPADEMDMLLLFS